MSHNDQHQIPVAYPPPMTMEPPVGYPTSTVEGNHVPADTRSRGDGFWKGCCAALCCCCVLDACF
ncbi:putative cysteine-rich transmembrane CYSTM domain-containing protein [Helianthus annuus]|uniref:Cysteine-rich transmembrane CYSTM domain-containing protein n=1 Tax=Helianthus annuus TaxID=4232 RepID=A0A251V8U8_HELAN|nr:putative cysteine-rich transmembrane CYSTM domain-containing protein [Helianthus annuus]KAJ0936474.1 putative cysteine-rich transmembrane CYSTM domain-containing protein [Helianthus annuus]